MAAKLKIGERVVCDDGRTGTVLHVFPQDRSHFINNNNIGVMWDKRTRGVSRGDDWSCVPSRALDRI